MKNIKDFNFKGKKAIVRVDFNVPLNDKFEVTDDNRILAATPTIKELMKKGAGVILMSHLGRPKGKEEKFSLKHILPVLSNLLGTDVQFADDCIGSQAIEKSKNLQAGEVLLLENLRFYPEEKKGDRDFSEKLANLADVYVNDAFGTAHRAHASTTVIADFFPENKMFGFVIENELENLQKVLSSPQKPFTAILGGAKVSSKITVIEKLLDTVDRLIIVGGMTYTFIKAQGGNIGNSLYEEDYLETAKKVLEVAKNKGTEIYLPSDSLNADDFSNDANTKITDSDKIPAGWMGLDIGPKAEKELSAVIESSSTILWNGPAGVFEMDNFANGTVALANALVSATKKGAYTLVGGGDSVAAIKKFKLENDVSYVSTGGGAMLESLEGKDLPGIMAVKS
ncbi:MAG: phosphoglycerate kinase [Bacteroidota bacterium]|nr:phosphoglycerate kinase [Bacteroidota bacterium]